MRHPFSKLLSATALAASLLIPASSLAGDTFLFDFGADANRTTGGVAPTPIYWNNVPASMANFEGGLVSFMVTTNNSFTEINLEIVSRFNGANENGATSGNTEFDPQATRDSLFGNTEVFSGLENITPIFRLTGLDPSATYALKFYASRTGVTDNRETRYTVTGATEEIRDLNVANNVTGTVSVPSMAPDANGHITIALTPGPNNDNANHFTYLGALQIDPSTGSRLLVDFGSDGQQTIAGNELPSPFWNNVTATVGGTDTGTVSGIVTTNGTPTDVVLSMVARFNGANTAGSAVSTLFPASATQDSLFGNTEAFSGLSNINPVFKLAGLDPGNVYSFVFYGSRTGVSDNRETRYTATGANSAFADLNTSNNTNNTASVTGVKPTTGGEITIALTSGPNNNNANHFTYLGVMRVDSEQFREPRILIDFGATGRVTGSANDLENVWNDVTTVVGSTSTGTLPNLVRTSGGSTSISLQMVSRFNGANENGTDFSSLFTATATRDSLYGNTELFGGAENITPVFKLTGLSPSTAYTMTLYASRTGVSDNRETRYTVTGEGARVGDLNVANNTDEAVVLAELFPSAAGELQVALTPGPNNDNANHFTYLGVLQLDWSSTPTPRPTLSNPVVAGASFSVTVTGVAGKTYKIQRTRDFSGWVDSGVTITLAGASGVATIPQAESHYFYRAVQQ